MRVLRNKWKATRLFRVHFLLTVTVPLGLSGCTNTAAVVLRQELSACQSTAYPDNPATRERLCIDAALSRRGREAIGPRDYSLYVLASHHLLDAAHDYDAGRISQSAYAAYRAEVNAQLDDIVRQRNEAEDERRSRALGAFSQVMLTARRANNSGVGAPTVYTVNRLGNMATVTGSDGALVTCNRVGPSTTCMGN